MEPIGWTQQQAFKVQTLAEQGKWGSHCKAIGISTSIPLIALMESGVGFSKIFLGMSTLVMKKTASFIGLGKWSPDCPTVLMMARRVVLTLHLLATFALTTITIPFLLFNSKIVAQECRMLLPFAEAYKRPAPQVVLPAVELHNSSPGQYTADGSVESSSWLSQLWGKTPSWCQNHPQLIGAAGVGGALIGGYLIYQYASSSPAGFPPLSNATPSPIPTTSSTATSTRTSTPTTPPIPTCSEYKNVEIPQILRKTPQDQSVRLVQQWNGKECAYSENSEAVASVLTSAHIIGDIASTAEAIERCVNSVLQCGIGKSELDSTVFSENPGVLEPYRFVALPVLPGPIQTIFDQPGGNYFSVAGKTLIQLRNILITCQETYATWGCAIF